jgi:hypothetical protein
MVKDVKYDHKYIFTLPIKKMSIYIDIHYQLSPPPIELSLILATMYVLTLMVCLPLSYINLLNISKGISEFQMLVFTLSMIIAFAILIYN